MSDYMIFDGFDPRYNCDVCGTQLIGTEDFCKKGLCEHCKKAVDDATEQVKYIKNYNKNNE